MGIFTGSSILTPHAKFQLQNQIKAFLQKTSRKDDDPVVEVILKVSQKLDSPTFHTLAQSLSGFNEALLMHKQTLQLPIADPLGFQNGQDFTKAVHDAVGQSNCSAPQPQNDFHPIRTGLLRIRALRVVDTFGRVQNLALKDHKVMATEIMTTPANPHLVFLPPRLMQPARLNFRWPAAEGGDPSSGDESEMNAHPETTPICGWFLPNNLDNSLMVYDNSGQALGSIGASERKWIPAPGTSILPNEDWNVHLRTLVTHLLHVPDPKDEGPAFLEDFLSGIEGALQRIDPENFAQHEALALLMGRPIAVVRAVVNLELRGQPAINQDWNVFRTDIERDQKRELTQADGSASQPAERETDAVERVRFPIRLGDDRQLNDGLVGYWKEQRSKDKIQGIGISSNRISAIGTSSDSRHYQNIFIKPKGMGSVVIEGPLHGANGTLAVKGALEVNGAFRVNGLPIFDYGMRMTQGQYKAAAEMLKGPSYRPGCFIFVIREDASDDVCCLVKKSNNEVQLLQLWLTGKERM